MKRNFLVKDNLFIGVRQSISNCIHREDLILIGIVRGIGLYIFIILFVGAGMSHFMLADGFANMFPEVVPFKKSIVYASGLIEWLLAILLLIPKTRSTAGVYTAIYLVVIFPANIYAAIYGIPAPWSAHTSQTILWVRLLFQPLLIWWVLAVSRNRKSS